MPVRTQKGDEFHGSSAIDSYAENLKAAALRYARAGFAVLPMLSTSDGGKRPLLEHGFKDASADPAKVDIWFSDKHIMQPGVMLGIATGEESGLLVVDCDVKNGQNGPQTFYELCKKHGASPSVCSVKTPSGGRHYYYRISRDRALPSSVGKFSGVDIRCEGGCIVAPPSRSAAGKYYQLAETATDIAGAPDLPDWLYAELSATSSVAPASAGGEMFSVSPEVVRRGLALLGKAQPGKRNTRLYAVSCSLFRALGPLGEEARNGLIADLFRTAQKLELPDSEIRNSINSALNKALQLGPFKNGEDIPTWLRGLLDSVGGESIVDEDEPDDATPGRLLVLPPPPLNFWPQELQRLTREISSAKNVSLGMVMTMLLALGSTCTGYSRLLELKEGDWHEPALLWIVLVAGSGTGKSHTKSLIFGALKQREAGIKTHYRKKRAEYERKRDEWRRNKDGSVEMPKEPENIQFTVEDTTLEALAELFRWNAARGLALNKDEAYALFQNLDKYTSKGNSKDRFLTMYDADPWQYSRKTQDGQSREMYIPRAPLSFFGMMQTSVLPEFFSKTDIKLGFAQRCCIVCAQTDSPPVFNSPAVSPATLTALSDMTNRMLDFEMGDKNPVTDLCDPIIVKLSPEARALFENFHDQTGRKMAQSSDEEGSWYSKVIRNTARVALVLYCLTQAARGRDAKSDPLSGEIMEAAIRTTGWMDKHRQILSPFSELEFRQSPRPVDRLLARVIARHAKDIRQAKYTVLMKTLIEWCEELSGESFAPRVVGHSASRLGIPCVHTRAGNARKFSEKTFEVCERFCAVMGDVI